MSLALVLATPDRLVVASDSRAFDGEARVDNVKKIDVSGGFALAATKHGQVALDAWRATAPIAGESAACRVRRIVGTMNGVVTPHPQGYLTLFGVFKFAGPDVDGHAVKLQIAPSATRPVVVEEAAPEAVPYALTFGWDDNRDTRGYITRRIMPRLQARPGEGAMVALARATIHAAARHSAKVGGPIHVAVLDESGDRWIP